MSGQAHFSSIIASYLHLLEDDIATPEKHQAMKSTLADDRFDNGRTPRQLRESFENSYATVIAYASERIIGRARVLSDGVCNTYIEETNQ